MFKTNIYSKTCEQYHTKKRKEVFKLSQSLSANFVDYFGNVMLEKSGKPEFLSIFQPILLAEYDKVA